jgi:methylated-DNA-protein-cysteine methyltransferase-like protein
MDDRRYFQLIHEYVRTIPRGVVMSYGQVAAAVGCSARIAGWALANVTDDNVPWHRVVGADGYLRIGKRSVALQEAQRGLLEREGITFKENGCVDMERHQAGRDVPLGLTMARTSP